jgi:hypothetical protein
MYDHIPGGNTRRMVGLLSRVTSSGPVIAPGILPHKRKGSEPVNLGVGNMMLLTRSRVRFCLVSLVNQSLVNVQRRMIRESTAMYGFQTFLEDYSNHVWNTILLRVTTYFAHVSLGSRYALETQLRMTTQ